MAKHAVVRTDLLDGTDVRGQLVSVKYMGADGNTPTEIDNGNVLKVESLIDGDREVYVGAIPTADTDINDIVLIASVEVLYDEHKKNLDDYVNEEGKICRGYRLRHGNTFSVTKEALDGVESPAKGNIVELKASTKLNIVEAATSGSTVIGKILDVEVGSRYTYYVIKID